MAQTRICISKPDDLLFAPRNLAEFVTVWYLERSEKFYRHDRQDLLLCSDLLRMRVFWREEVAGVE